MRAFLLQTAAGGLLGGLAGVIAWMVGWERAPLLLGFAMGLVVVLVVNVRQR